MKVDTRRITLVATILAIAMIAVGIGFAYTAFTQNGGNNTDVAYITVTQVGEPTPYTFADSIKVEMDTYTDDSENVYYRIADSKTIDLGNDKYTVAVLGTIEFHATITGDTPPSKLSLSVLSSAGFDATSNWEYFITSVPDNNGIINTVYASKTSVKTTAEWTAGSALEMTHKSDNEYNNVTVCVCYGYSKDLETIEVGDLKFINIAEAPKKLDDASIVFKADSVTTITYNANNGEQTPATETVVKTGTVKNYQFIAKPDNFIAPQDKQYFVGWNTDKDADEALPNGQTITTDITYYAIWSATQPSSP